MRNNCGSLVSFAFAFYNRALCNFGVKASRNRVLQRKLIAAVALLRYGRFYSLGEQPHAVMSKGCFAFVVECGYHKQHHLGTISSRVTFPVQAITFLPGASVGKPAPVILLFLATVPFVGVHSLGVYLYILVYIRKCKRGIIDSERYRAAARYFDIRGRREKLGIIQRAARREYDVVFAPQTNT